jgi:hypothetical protein
LIVSCRQAANATRKVKASLERVGLFLELPSNQPHAISLVFSNDGDSQLGGNNRGTSRLSRYSAITRLVQNAMLERLWNQFTFPMDARAMWAKPGVYLLRGFPAVIRHELQNQASRIRCQEDTPDKSRDIFLVMIQRHCE